MLKLNEELYMAKLATLSLSQLNQERAQLLRQLGVEITALLASQRLEAIRKYLEMQKLLNISND